MATTPTPQTMEYKTSYIGLKSWETKFLEDVESLLKDFEYLSLDLVPRPMERLQSLESLIHEEVILAVKENRAPNFDKFT